MKTLNLFTLLISILFLPSCGEETMISGLSGTASLQHEITLNGDIINGTFNFDGEGNDDIQADVSGEFSVIAEAQ